MENRARTGDRAPLILNRQSLSSNHAALPRHNFTRRRISAKGTAEAEISISVKNTSI
jgi:hypothetical protein